jgi:hypothetical protein
MLIAFARGWLSQTRRKESKDSQLSALRPLLDGTGTGRTTGLGCEPARPRSSTAGLLEPRLSDRSADIRFLRSKVLCRIGIFGKEVVVRRKRLW